MPLSIVATLHYASKSGIVTAQMRSAVNPALRCLTLDPNVIGKLFLATRQDREDLGPEISKSLGRDRIAIYARNNPAHPLGTET